MGYCEQSSVVVEEPVSLDYVKKRLGLPAGVSRDDEVLQGLIAGSRRDCERLSGLTVAKRTFTQVLDAFPYYTDTVQSQQAYPPNYYSLPRYSTTLWNYSQMIKIARAPLISIDRLVYVQPDGTEAQLESGIDFIVDPVTRLARIFPFPGRYWPATLYCPNAVRIELTAGFDPDSTKIVTYALPSPPPSPASQQTEVTVVVGIPQDFVNAISALVEFRYQNWGTPGVPEAFERAFQGLGVVEFPRG